MEKRYLDEIDLNEHISDEKRYYKEILKKDPSADLFFPFAKWLTKTGEREEAIQILKRGLSSYPSHIMARSLLVNLLTTLSYVSQDILEEWEVLKKSLREIAEYLRPYGLKLAEEKKSEALPILLFYNSLFPEDDEVMVIIKEFLSQKLEKVRRQKEKERLHKLVNILEMWTENVRSLRGE